MGSGFLPESMPFMELGLGYHTRAHAPWVLDSGYHARDLSLRAQLYIELQLGSPILKGVFLAFFKGYMSILIGFSGQFYLDLSDVIVFHIFLFSPLFLFILKVFLI
jgi:hypothetical protein